MEKIFVVRFDGEMMDYGYESSVENIYRNNIGEFFRNYEDAKQWALDCCNELVDAMEDSEETAEWWLENHTSIFEKKIR